MMLGKLSNKKYLGFIAGFLTSFSVTGCHSGASIHNKAPDTSIALSWPDVMDSWKTEIPGSIYSLSFFDQPPNGMFIRAISYNQPEEDSCETFRTEQYLQASSERDDWVLLLQVSNNKLGEFLVKPADAYGNENTAQVIVKHIVHGKEVERHTGLEGILVVSASPETMEEQLSKTAFAVQGNVVFSSSEHLQQGCSIGGPTDGTDVVSTCYCLGPDGETFSCPGVAGEPSCCIDTKAVRWNFPISIASSPCPHACLTNDLTLRTFCIQLGAKSYAL